MQLICICLADFRSMAAKIAATKKKEKIASFIANEGKYMIQGEIDIYYTPSKNNLFRNSNTRDNELRHENGCAKLSCQLRGEHCKCSSDFFPSDALVNVEKVG